MNLKEASFYRFRNIDEQKLVFDPHVTVLHGKNGQGKTNVLEALSFFSNCRSFRTMHEEEFIQFGAEEAGMSISFTDGKIPLKMQCVILKNPRRRICRIDGVERRSMADFIGIFRTVIFTPVHLNLVTDGAQVRRRFLDSAISQLDGHFLRTLQHYNGILNQRNSYLKQLRIGKGESAGFDDTAAVLSEQLSKDGEEIARIRAEYVESLTGYVSEAVKEMSSGAETTGIRYTQPRTAEEYYRLMETNFASELRAGASMYGPHRDDMKIELNGSDARYFASQGQLRSIALALKLGEGEMSKKKHGSYPVFLLDDVLSELDPYRREFLMSGMGEKQVVITTCDEVKLGGTVYEVENGVYTPRGRSGVESAARD